MLRNYSKSFDDETSFHTAFDTDFDSDHKLYASNDELDYYSTCTDISSPKRLSEISHFEVTWTNLSHEISKKTSWVNKVKKSLNFIGGGRLYHEASTPKTILNNVCGSFKSGELTAIMGISGSGKTLLLKCLAGRKTIGYSGRIVASHESERRLKICFIPQNDCTLNSLTVRENMNFASRLKNPKHKFDHKENVMKITKLLQLEDCIETISSCLSGGQSKRLLVGQELLSNPDILIMDEPTSGLDSLTCSRTMKVFQNIVIMSRNFVVKPIAILITIHQPDPDVMLMLDKIYCLSVDSFDLYKDSSIKLNKNPDINDPPRYKQGSSYCRESKAIMKNSHDEFLLASNYDNSHPSEESICTSKKELYLSPRLEKLVVVKDKYVMKKTWILIERYLMSNMNDPRVIICRLLYHIVVPIFMAMLSTKLAAEINGCGKFDPMKDLMNSLSDDNENKPNHTEVRLLIYENISFMFFVAHSLFSSVIGSSYLSTALSVDRKKKEMSNNWYSVASYLISQMLIELPMTFFFSLSTVALSFIASKQTIPQQWRIILGSVAIFMASAILETTGSMIGIFVKKDIQTGLFISQIAAVAPLIISGFVVRLSETSLFIKVISWFFFYRPTMSIVTLARYGFDICGLNCNEINLNKSRNEMLEFPLQLNNLMHNLSNHTGNHKEKDLQSNNLSNSNHSTNSQGFDIFQLFAEQISLENNFGSPVKTCDDLRPIALRMLELKDSDILSHLSIILFMLIISKLTFSYIFIKKMS